MNSDFDKPEESPEQSPKPENPFGKWIGAFPAFNSPEEFKAFWRDLRGRDEFDDEEEAGMGEPNK